MLDLLLELRLLPFACRTPGVEKPLFCLEHFCRRKIAGARKQERKLELGGSNLLGLEPCPPYDQLVDILNNYPETCTRLRFIQPHEQLTGINLVTISDAQFTNYAACGVLDLFDMTLDDEGALRDDCACELSGSCPASNHENEQAGQRQPYSHVFEDCLFDLGSLVIVARRYHHSEEIGRSAEEKPRSRTSDVQDARSNILRSLVRDEVLAHDYGPPIF